MSLYKYARTALVALVVAVPAHAQTLAVNNGVPYYAPSIGNFSTLGNNMFGMTVTGKFSDGQTFSGAWKDLGGGLTGVDFAGRFRLTIGATDNTFNMPWTLTVFGTSNQLTTLTLSGATGPVIFDRTFGGVEGTPTSANGTDFQLAAPDVNNILATYINSVQMVGSSGPVGDLFETLQIAFRTPFVGSAAGKSLSFYQDVDNVILGGLLSPVPEPATVLMTAAGLAALALAARRRQIAAAALAKVAAKA
jgi:PEP-CTERM motif